MALALGGRPGERLAARLSMPVNADTLLRLLDLLGLLGLLRRQAADGRPRQDRPPARQNGSAGVKQAADQHRLHAKAELERRSTGDTSIELSAVMVQKRANLLARERTK